MSLGRLSCRHRSLKYNIERERERERKKDNQSAQPLSPLFHFSCPHPPSPPLPCAAPHALFRAASIAALPLLIDATSAAFVAPGDVTVVNTNHCIEARQKRRRERYKPPLPLRSLSGFAPALARLGPNQGPAATGRRQQRGAGGSSCDAADTRRRSRRASEEKGR